MQVNILLHSKQRKNGYIFLLKESNQETFQKFLHHRMRDISWSTKISIIKCCNIYEFFKEGNRGRDHILFERQMLIIKACLGTMIHHYEEKKQYKIILSRIRTIQKGPSNLKHHTLIDFLVHTQSALCSTQFHIIVPNDGLASTFELSFSC